MYASIVWRNTSQYQCNRDGVSSKCHLPKAFVYLHGKRRRIVVFFSSRRRHTRYWRDWSSDVCSSDLAEDILRDADTAMYRAKSNGKARYEIFDKAMHARAINLLQMETDMRRALERDEFLLHYQPIVALDNFRLRGFEALVRWQHPERGFISPMDFIPVAEETGMIIQLGEWVMREACKQMQRWQKAFLVDPPLSISVNLSSKK